MLLPSVDGKHTVCKCCDLCDARNENMPTIEAHEHLELIRCCIKNGNVEDDGVSIPDLLSVPVQIQILDIRRLECKRTQFDDRAESKRKSALVRLWSRNAGRLFTTGNCALRVSRRAGVIYASSTFIQVGSGNFLILCLFGLIATWFWQPGRSLGRDFV